MTINGLYTLNNYVNKEGDFIVFSIEMVNTKNGKNKGLRFKYVDIFTDKADALKLAIEKRFYVTQKNFLKKA